MALSFRNAGYNGVACWNRTIYESLVLYIDPSFKDSSKNDYKAAKLWGRPRAGLKTAKRSELHCLRAFVRQCSVGEMVRWVYDLWESLPEDAAVTIYMEANFMQDTKWMKSRSAKATSEDIKDPSLPTRAKTKLKKLK